ncbi:hypothetical protein M0813_07602 [Anaeramoeba flamelloides]|uniref:Uncharacterized protein n=1 Tax=Anaeramoeba flamelloides TaxID=1746091 RepID=A0ABQ8XAS0_9EUKA|nr:hypothetical protein M0813_07602 [Anaeramoeba flamelloides]
MVCNKHSKYIDNQRSNKKSSYSEWSSNVIYSYTPNDDFGTGCDISLDEEPPQTEDNIDININYHNFSDYSKNEYELSLDSDEVLESESRTETDSSSDFEPHILKEKKPSNLENILKGYNQPSSDYDQSEEENNESVIFVSHTEYDYTQTENEVEKLRDLQKKNPLLFDINHYRKSILEVKKPEIFLTKEQLVITEVQDYIFHLNKKHKPLNSNTSVNQPDFEPASIFDVKSIKKQNIVCDDDETLFILSIYIDDQSHTSKKSNSIKAVYLVVENFKTGFRLKNKTIFLLCNLPKGVPIYNLFKPLPFIKEIYRLINMETLFDQKIKVIFHQIIGDTIEQQKAAGKVDHSGLQMCRYCCLSKKDIRYNLGKNIKTKKEKNENQNKVLNQNNYCKQDILVSKRCSEKHKNIQKQYSINFFRSQDKKKVLDNFQKIKTHTGILFQKGNFWLHLFDFKCSDFSKFSICWAHLLLEGLLKDGLKSIKKRVDSELYIITVSFTFKTQTFNEI